MIIMSLEDTDNINSYRRHINWLKTVGDDQSNQQERRYFYSMINEIKNKYETPESRAHKEELRIAREVRADLKRDKIYRTKRKKEIALLKTITPRQVAINKICDINYSIRNICIHPWHNESDKKRIRKEYQKIKSKKMKIMKEFNLKSTDIRRQKQYNKKYD
jgi:hypothetical protein